MAKEQGHVVCAGLGGSFWFTGWLFTIGFAKLGFWKGVWALLLWPYYLGVIVQTTALGT